MESGLLPKGWSEYSEGRNGGRRLFPGRCADVSKLRVFRRVAVVM